MLDLITWPETPCIYSTDALSSAEVSTATGLVGTVTRQTQGGTTNV